MDDTRCCGTGTCIINDKGFCWCGQQWNGERMCFPEPTQSMADALAARPAGDIRVPVKDGGPSA
jgi:hypothetical protein